ncbi:hypothetical protein SDC9_133455 [bioreactor metagenome]|uniref:Uncharacterized protein n=1 Tax=bioreactor metagenome TaxID=1076179 RepID=A0A645DAB1_9ZZZZ
MRVFGVEIQLFADGCNGARRRCPRRIAGERVAHARGVGRFSGEVCGDFVKRCRSVLGGESRTGVLHIILGKRSPCLLVFRALERSALCGDGLARGSDKIELIRLHKPAHKEAHAADDEIHRDGRDDHADCAEFATELAKENRARRRNQLRH